MTGILNALIAGVSGAVKDAYFNLVSLLLPGNGTNGAQNNTFLDSSTNNFTITPNGNTTQGTFSPFSQTGWGNYFDGTANGSLRADSTTDTNLSGDFTIQAWVYPTANGQSSNSEIISRGAAATLNGWHFGLVASTTQLYFGVNYASSGNTSTSTQSSTNISLNQWTHVAVTRSGNTCRIYINGVVDTTNTGFTGTPTVSGTEYVYVGRGSYDSTNRQFTGYINNASIIKGTALTTFSQTQPLATGTSGQALLTCTTNRFIDTNTATTAKTLTAGSGVSVVAFSPFAPTAAYTTAAVGGSGYFDGTGDYLTTPNNSALYLTTNNFTLEGWIYLASTSTTQNIVRGANSFSIGILQSSGSLIYYISSNGSSWDIASAVSMGSITANAWVHFALVRNGSTFTPYINGVAGTTATSSSSIANTNGLIVFAETGGTLPATGYCSNLRLVNGTAITPPAGGPTAPLTAVSNTSLLLNFTNAGITDATAKNDLETVGNAQISTTVNTPFNGTNGSMYFDGAGTPADRLTGPNTQNTAFGTGNFVIEFFVYPTSSSATFRSLFDSRSGAVNTGISIWQNGTSIEIYGASQQFVASSVFTINSWQHVAVSRSSNTVRVYVGGTQRGSNYTNSNDMTDTRLVIGNDNSLAYPFVGYISNFRITKGNDRNYTGSTIPVPTAPFPVQ